MSLIKYTLFKLLRYIYLLPSVVLLLWVKKQSNFQTKSKKFLIEYNSELNIILNQLEKYYLKNSIKEIEGIISKKRKELLYSSEIHNILSSDLDNKLLKVLKNDEFCNYLSLFFGYKLKFNSYLIRLNFYNSRLKEEEGPKMWHRDNDSFFGQIKLFSVINDLKTETGGLFSFIPQNTIRDHEYVKNTNDGQLINKSDRGSRILNSEMIKVKGVRESIVNFGLNKNQYLAIDTNDTYHKGGYLQKDKSIRILLQVIYEPYFNSLSNYNYLYKKNILIYHLKNFLTGIKNRLRTQIKI